MHRIVTALVGLSALALTSAAPAYSKDAGHATCPGGDARLGGICIGAANCAIVLPATRTADASLQAGAER